MREWSRVWNRYELSWIDFPLQINICFWANRCILAVYSSIYNCTFLICSRKTLKESVFTWRKKIDWETNICISIYMNARILSLLETIKIDKLTVLNIFEDKSHIFQSKQHNFTEQRTFLYSAVYFVGKYCEKKS